MDEQKDLLPEEKETTEKRRPILSKRMYYALLMIFAGVFLLSALYVGNYFHEVGNAQQDYDNLEDLYLQGLTQPTTIVPPISSLPTGIPGTNPTTPTGPTILSSLQSIYALNNDTVGYLYFPDGVGISYPVMQSPYDEDFYLTHKFDKTPNGDVAIGCPYVPLRCDVFAPSDNVIIAGHYLKSGGMFAPLHQYQDWSFWEKHQTFSFDTLYEQHTYQIFAVFKTVERQYLEDGTPYGYPFHTKVNFSNEEEFNQFVSEVKGSAFEEGGYTGYVYYDTDITPQYGDKLLTLYTCEYGSRDPYTNEFDGRLVVVAVRID